MVDLGFFVTGFDRPFKQSFNLICHADVVCGGGFRAQAKLSMECSTQRGCRMPVSERVLHRATAKRAQGTSGGSARARGAVLHPDRTVQAAVLNGFEEMVLPNRLRLGQIGDGPRHLEDPVVGSGTEVEVVHGVLEQGVA